MISSLVSIEVIKLIFNESNEDNSRLSCESMIYHPLEMILRVERVRVGKSERSGKGNQ